MALDPTVVAEKLAAAIHRPVDDPNIVDAVAAAIEYVRTYTGYIVDDMELPDDPLTVAGLVLLAGDVFLAPAALGGGGAIGDPTFIPRIPAANLAQQNQDYWNRLILPSGWGIA